MIEGKTNHKTNSLGGRLALGAADLRLLAALLLDLLQRGAHDRAVELGGLARAVWLLVLGFG